ncbi:MAG: hypothetical protein IJH04_08565 [Eggerthellaceae bacterium]|nr:hypothetical protein [Eggerthellaceae bacterium]
MANSGARCIKTACAAALIALCLAFGLTGCSSGQRSSAASGHTSQQSSVALTESQQAEKAARDAFSGTWDIVVLKTADLYAERDLLELSSDKEGASYFVALEENGNSTWAVGSDEVKQATWKPDTPDHAYLITSSGLETDLDIEGDKMIWTASDVQYAVCVRHGSMLEPDDPEEYKASCESISYDDIARTPKDWLGKPVTATGKIMQVKEEDRVTLYLIQITKGDYGVYKDITYVYYFGDIESRFLEDDVVTIYGTSNGITTYETVMGAKKSVPQITAKYIELA